MPSDERYSAAYGDKKHNLCYTKSYISQGNTDHVEIKNDIGRDFRRIKKKDMAIIRRPRADRCRLFLSKACLCSYTLARLDYPCNKHQ